MLEGEIHFTGNGLLGEVLVVSITPEEVNTIGWIGSHSIGNDGVASTGLGRNIRNTGSRIGSRIHPGSISKEGKPVRRGSTIGMFSVIVRPVLNRGVGPIGTRIRGSQMLVVHEVDRRRSRSIGAIRRIVSKNTESPLTCESRNISNRSGLGSRTAGIGAEEHRLVNVDDGLIGLDLGASSKSDNCESGKDEILFHKA